MRCSTHRDKADKKRKNQLRQLYFKFRLDEIANIKTSISAKQNIPQKEHKKAFLDAFCYIRIYKTELNSQSANQMKE